MGEMRKRIVAEVEADEHVPKIGAKVWVIYKDTIFEEQVYALGERTFILAAFKMNTFEDFWEWRYKDYGKRWFVDFESAEEELLSKYGDEYKLECYESKWYEVVKK